MTQDCSITPSVANENDKRFPKGIRIKSTDATSEPVKQQVSNAEDRAGDDQLPWGYLFVHNRQVEVFKKEMDAYNLAHPEAPHACFVHYSNINRRVMARESSRNTSPPSVASSSYRVTPSRSKPSYASITPPTIWSKTVSYTHLTLPTILLV